MPDEPTIQDLLTYLEATPDDSWCTQIRDDGKGRHCVLGHLDLDPRFSLRLVYFGITNTVLAAVNNNGDPKKGWWEVEVRKTSSRRIKARVLKYIRENAKADE